MKTTREFAPADRYLYDFGPCSSGNGWAQVDTAQDASYFGNWANPTKLLFFSYCEGDTTLVECETEAEFVDYLRKTADWYAKNDGAPAKIDPGLNEEITAAFTKLGLADLLH